jgi:5-methylcytosine-specific restriction protein A
MVSFEKYLKNKGLSARTIRNYISGIKLIQKRWKLPIFNTKSARDIKSMRQNLQNDTKFQKFNEDSHRIYSSALTAYEKFILRHDNVATDENFNALVSRSIKDNSKARKKRLLNASKKPKKLQTVSTIYKRNPDVVAEVLTRAGGKCESCGKRAPFVRESGEMAGQPFLEVHHKKWLSEGGEDTIDNAVAMCPNCHRQEHYGLRKFY